MPPKSSAPHNRVPSDMQHFHSSLPVWKEKWFRSIPVDQSQPMKGEMKAQAHSTGPEYQVPFDNPSPGESPSPSLGNGTLLNNIVAFLEERHLPDSVDDTDDAVPPSNATHAFSDTHFIMPLLGVPHIISSTRNNVSGRNSPLGPTSSSGSVPLYQQATAPDSKPQEPYYNIADIRYNPYFEIFAPTPGPLFQQEEPQSYSDVAPIVQYPSAYSSVIGEVQPVQSFSAGSEIYAGPTHAPATTEHQSFPDTTPYYAGYRRSNQRIYPSRARPYPPLFVSRGMRHMVRTDRSLEPSDINSHTSGAQQYHAYSRYDAEQGHTPRAVLNGTRTPENFVHSPSPFQSSTNLTDDGGLLYRPPQQQLPFPDQEFHLGDFSNYM